MKKLSIFIIFFVSYLAVAAQSQKAPAIAMGSFTDDYGINYTINDSLWIQHPNVRYHIIKWNSEKQYLIAKNDSANPSDKNKYTRIDYMSFDGMAPYLWGFCLTAYKAESDRLAEETASADRLNPRKGCNGYPFSRMKRTDTQPDKNKQ